MISSGVDGKKSQTPWRAVMVSRSCDCCSVQMFSREGPYQCAPQSWSCSAPGLSERFLWPWGERGLCSSSCPSSFLYVGPWEHHAPSSHLGPPQAPSSPSHSPFPLSCWSFTITSSRKPSLTRCEPLGMRSQCSRSLCSIPYNWLQLQPVALWLAHACFAL